MPLNRYLHVLHSTWSCHVYPGLMFSACQMGLICLNGVRAEVQSCTNTVMGFPDWCSLALFGLNTMKLHLTHPDAGRKLYVSLGEFASLGKGVILLLLLSAVPHKCEQRDGLRAHQRSSIWPTYRHGLRLKGRSEHLQSQIVYLLSCSSFLRV